MTLDEFSEQKTSEALQARIPGLVTDVERAPSEMLAVGNAWTRALFDGAFFLSPAPSAKLPACTLTFVQSRNGNTGAKNPSALGGGETDKHLIYEGLSRVAADAVLSGAETIRGGHIVFSVWHPELVALRESLGKPRHPAQIVATLRGLDIEGSLMFNAPDLRVFVLTVGDCAELMRRAFASRPWITPIVMPGKDDLPWAFEQLRAAGVEHLSCVGGRRLATQLLDTRLVQDVYLTTAARDGGEPRTPMYDKPLGMELVVRKHGRGSETGVVFEHWREAGA